MNEHKSHEIIQERINKQKWEKISPISSKDALEICKKDYLKIWNEQITGEGFIQLRLLKTIVSLRAQLAESEEKREAAEKEQKKTDIRNLKLVNEGVKLLERAEAAEADAGELRRKWRELKNLHEKRNTVNSRNSSPSAFNYDEGAVLEAENAVFYFLEDIEEILSSDHPGADRLKKLEGALEFYADEGKYTWPLAYAVWITPYEKRMMHDRGDKARAALGRE